MSVAHLYRRALLVLGVLAVIILVTAPTFGADQGPPAPAVERTAPVLNQDSPSAIPGEYIVVFKKGVGNRSINAAARAVERRGGTVHHTYATALQGFAAHVPEQALNGLRNNPNVAYIEADQTVTADVTWGLDRIDQRQLPLDNSYSPGANGSGVNAYIIDTGIRTTHNEFGGRAYEGYSAIGGSAQDCNGHGTHVAGTVGGNNYGVADGVTLYAVRVLDCNGSGTTSGVIAGVDWVTSNHQDPAVANMSLGGSASTSLDNAISNSIAAGVTYAVAAGNDNANACYYSPARVNTALTVGATTSSDSRSSFSNYGSCLDIFAPGSSITSAWYTSNSATNTISGTSMASPHVAGAAALYLGQNPGASPATVFNALVSNATSGVISNVGSGSPNLLLFWGDTSDPDPEPTPEPTPDPGDDPCTNCDQYSGSLSGSGDYDWQPNGNYYYSGSGTHQGWLEGPVSADFDLYLYKWSSWYGWYRVASSLSYDSSESISYNGSSGYYVWRVESYSGSGSYDFWLDRP